MKSEQAQVREFMVKAGQATPDKPTMCDDDVYLLRVKLIQEELEEFEKALYEKNLVETYDAILDLLVVTIGAAVALGLDLEPGWQEVHRSNMSKFIDGHRREDGKWVKGPSYSPANLAPIVEAQR